MYILSIETSCDETAISIIESNTDMTNFKVHSDLVISQINIHAHYGGVFPALAKREHAHNLVPLLKQSFLEMDQSIHRSIISIDTNTEHTVHEILDREPELEKQLLDFFKHNTVPHIDMIMVTHGPGLAPALWVGVNFARAVSVIFHSPIIPVNHMEGHITSILLKDAYREQDQALYPLSDFRFPMIALLISGGHTQIILVRDWCDYEILGETIDDAVGEAFDKVARMLGMTYPGGPQISIAAQQGKADPSISFPRPMLHSGDYRYSFSGLKTSVRYKIQDLQKQAPDGILDSQTISNIAREFEHAVTEVLLKKTMNAITEYHAHGLIIAGGVSANRFIAETFKQKTSEYGIDLYLPEKHMCGDNSLMIATAGFMNLRNKKTPTPQSEIGALGNLKL
jgi:N6-L-threonylcarbamoyladenine synthase